MMSETALHQTASFACFAAALQQDGFSTRLIERTPEQPNETLAVALMMEGHPAGGLQLQLSFVPGMEAQLQGCSLVQCFVAITGTAVAVDDRELCQAMATVNRISPLNGFGMLDQSGMLYFRHTIMLPPEPEPQVQLIVQTTWLISYLLELFGPGLAQLAHGNTSLAKVFKGHAYEHLIVKASV